MSSHFNEEWLGDDSIFDEYLPEHRFTKPDNDFISSCFQADLAHLIKDSNRIIFLPTERDKLYTCLILLKRFTCNLIGFQKEPKKRVVYLLDSAEKAKLITSFFSRYLPINVGCLTSFIVEKYWNKFYESNQIIIIPCELLSRSMKSFPIVPDHVSFFIFDDCIFGMHQDHPMKQVLKKISDFDTRILSFTSVLIPVNSELHWIYKNLKEMEISFKSIIISSQYCTMVKKYLAETKVKFVKYLPFAKNWYSQFSIFNQIFQLVENLRISVEKLKCIEAREQVIKRKLQSLLDKFIDVTENFGLHPALVQSNISLVKLEKIKLHCENSLFVFVSAVITDFKLISLLLQKEIDRSNNPDKVDTAMKNCCPKLMKLFSLLTRMKSDDNCVIFVKDCVTAQMLSYILQEICSSDTKLSHIAVDFLVDPYSVVDVLSDREKCIHEKNMKIILKKFHRQMINVLILSWKMSVETCDINANSIIYFDLPPDYVMYILSRKYANCYLNKNFFFLEEHQEGDSKCSISLIEPFAELDIILKEVIEKKDVNCVQIHGKYRKLQENEDELKRLFSPLITKRNKKAKLSNAISIVNKYCECLPGDAFSKTTVRWQLCQDSGVTCRLQLPFQSSIGTTIESARVYNPKFAKSAAALDTVKLLYKCGHLNEELQPTVHTVNSDIFNSSALFPQWRKEEDNLQAGSSNCYRIVPVHFPEWLYNCAPQPGIECYLHIIHLKPKYRVPEEPRKKFFHDLLESQDEFGIVTSKKLPEICLFPIYVDLGQIDVSIEVNAVVLQFTDEEVQKLITFHRFIFLDVLKIVKNFLVIDFSNRENSYCIVPLTPTNEGILNIAWNVVNNQSFKQEIVEPPDEQRIRTNHVRNNYLGKVVTPWYRMLSQKYYIVTKVLMDCTPNSPFSSSEFRTFSEYYADTYGIDVKQPIQPLLAARAITTNYNCIRPRSQNPGVLRKRGEKEMDFEETLIPELCIMEPLPAVYWLKSITLLAITHRLHYILIAETIRHQISSFENINSYESRLKDDTDVLIANKDCVNELEEVGKPIVPISAILKDVKMAKRKRTYPWGNEVLPVDAERNLNKTCILELIAENYFMKCHVTIDDKDVFELPPMVNQKVKNPFLKFLDLDCKLSPGPKQRDILQALTVSQCVDIINLERFKLMGNSFLKFAISLWLYKLYPQLNILQLNHLKKKLTGKRNLFYCGSKLHLGSMLKLQDLSVSNDWNFGGFCLPELLLNISASVDIPPEVIFDLEIPKNEQITGVLSPETKNYLHDRMLNYCSESTQVNVDSPSEDLMSPNIHKNHALIYFKKQSVPDKAVVDVLKALIGVYLMNCGVDGALKFLHIVDLLTENMTVREFFTFNAVVNPVENFIDFEKLSTILQYKFKSKQLPLEALTHHSCFPEFTTNCNQKLAFIGDSILDFLITGYIYENCGEKTISEVEDVRVALVNDILFAVLVVRMGLHKFLFLESSLLLDKIDKFISQQEKVNHEINCDEFLFLIEETNSRVTESVDVPRALSDTFKAIIAAIFLDSFGDLKTVWNVCYNIMKHEIEKFMNCFPKNPVKLLRETDLMIEYEKPKILKDDPSLLAVQMNILIDEENRSFVGTGSSKHQAMRIASKLALKNLCKNFTL